MHAWLLIGLLTSSPGSFDALIAGGGKTKADAEKAAAAIEAKLFHLRFGARQRSFPKVVRSDEVKGLRPGLFVAILGFCEKSSPVLEALRKIDPGIYARKVQGDFAESCPPLALIEPAAGEENELRSAIEAKPNDADRLVKYAAFLEQQALFEEAMIFIDRALELAPQHQGAKDLGHKITVLTTD